MFCKICRNHTQYIFKETILKKYSVSYFQCTKCGFIQTEDPFWLEEAYQSPIALIDTGIIERNRKMTDVSTFLIRIFFDKDAIYLDYAGGYGIFCRMMRDNGIDFYWTDPYCENLFSKGFESKPNTTYKLVTSFESFEHFVDPLYEIEKIFNYSESILFSTLLIPENIPEPSNWWYYAFNSGQHISLYSKKSLEEVANYFGKNFYTNNRNLHLISNIEINNTVFSLMTRMSYIIPSYLIKLGLKSKTIFDLDYLTYVYNHNSNSIGK